jgi:hypothetical protein
VRLLGYRAQNGQALGRYLHPVPAQEGGLFEGLAHARERSLDLILEGLKYSGPSAG